MNNMDHDHNTCLRILMHVNILFDSFPHVNILFDSFAFQLGEHALLIYTAR